MSRSMGLVAVANDSTSDCWILLCIWLGQTWAYYWHRYWYVLAHNINDRGKPHCTNEILGAGGHEGREDEGDDEEDEMRMGWMWRKTTKRSEGALNFSLYD